MAQQHLVAPLKGRMAMCTELLRPARRPRFQCLYQSSRLRVAAYRNARQFSSTSVVQATGSSHGRQDRRAQTRFMSPKIEQAKMFTQPNTIPTDIGLIPGTFVMPTGANVPSLVQDLKERMSMEWARLKAMKDNLVSSLHYKWFTRPSGAKKTHGKIILNYPFSTGKIRAQAEEMYRKMYTAFAEGDVRTLNGMCADGLLASFKSRLSRRRAGEKMQWECEILSRPKLVSHRVVQLPYSSPDGSKAAVRQAVVRLHTRQTLRRINTRSKTNRDEEVVTGDTEGEMTEYFVIQRRLWKQKEQEWQVWGMTEETTVTKLHELRDEAQLLTGSKVTQVLEKLKPSGDMKA